MPPLINRYSGERIDPNDGMADNPLAQALFHSQIGQGEWGASYRLVRNGTVVYSAFALLAFSPAMVVEATPLVQAGFRPGVVIFARLYGRYLATAVGGSSAVLEDIQGTFL